MKKALALLLTVLLLIVALSTGTSASTAPVKYGDIDWDGAITAVDATVLQRHLVHITELDYSELIPADYDHSGEADIIDATFIQRTATQIPVPDFCGGWADTNIMIGRYYASYDSGKAAVGIPVTFTADEVWGSTSDEAWGYKEITFDFLIDGRVVQPRSAQNTLTYTFDEARDYSVTVRAYNGYSFRRERVIRYKVVDEYSYNELQIVSAPEPNYHSRSRELTARAVGGTAPYRYSFTVTGLNGADAAAFVSYAQYHGDGGWSLVNNDESYCLYRDYSEEDTSVIETMMLDYSVPSYEYHLNNPFTVRIQVMDSTGALSEPVEYVYKNEQLIG